ncbi:MAG: LuxR C-terminal-related transcriptional regulator [Anaerolineales bacterium]|jgi:LuxR family maltose regulon positive regulatory protein
MAADLLSTRLYIPHPHQYLIPRPHLEQRLDEGASKSLMVVSAPAGYGKTTILSAWAEANKLPIAWLSLDAENNDPHNFMVHVIAALQKVLPDAGNASLALLRANPTASMQDALTVLINELAADPGDVCLILDDYHLIEAEEIHTALRFLIDNLPPRLHIVIATRSDPPIPLGQLRARGQLLELRQSDLRFSFEEAAAFLNQQEGLNLTDEQIADLEARTEGWIAGLQLAAISLRDKRDASAFIKRFSGSHRFVIDYLVEEVLARLSPEERSFLQHTSVLDRFNHALCDELTGRQDSARVLKQFEEDNLFLVPLDDHREWYRYHHLFREYLVSEMSDDQRSQLCKWAANWFNASGLHHESVKYALESGDVELTARLMCLAIPVLFKQGFLAIISRWLSSLPDDVLSRYEVLAIYKGFFLYFANSFEEAGSYAEAAAALISPQGSASDRGRLQSLKAHLALWEGEIEDCISLSREALENLDDDDASFRSMTANILGQVLEIKGDVISAVDHYRQELASALKDETVGMHLVIVANLAFSLNELGMRPEAISVCDQIHDAGGNLPVMVVLDLPRSLLSLEANDLDRAQEQVRHALGVLAPMNYTQGVLYGHYILAQVHLARREFEDLYRLTQAGFLQAPKGGIEAPHAGWFAALEAEADLQQGEISRCERWATDSGFTPADTPSYRLECAYLTFVRLLLAQGRLDEARKLLDTLEAAASNGKRIRKLITISLLHARLSLAQGRIDAAREHVRGALRLAAPGNYQRAFFNEGTQILQLLPRLKDAAPMFVNNLIGGDAAPQLTPGAGALSERELEILQWVAKGLSNREIAEICFITVGTVKKHLNNIFSKFHVKSRTQAILRGKELGLLE